MRTKSLLLLGGRVGVILLAAAALSACDVVVSGLNAKTKAQDEWTRSYPISPNGQVEVSNTNGLIEVTAGDSPQVQVRAERIARAATDEAAKELLAKLEIREDVTSDRIRLETKTPGSLGFGTHAEVRYHLTVPASVLVRVTNTNGTVELNGIKGKVRAETTNGSVRGNQLAGAVDARATNGSVKLEVSVLAADGIKAETTNGSVELTLPAGAKADIKADTVNGGIHVTGLQLEGGESSRRHVEGRVNGGGPAVALETTNGGIRILGK